MFKWLFGRTTPQERLQAQRRSETLVSLAKGGIPVEAQERIRQELALGKDFFASDLTAREYLVTRQNGLDVIGQVMGSSFYHVRFGGLYQGRWRQTGELVDLSKAHLDSRTLAISRMKQEAELLGASGVIGVKLKSNAHDWSNNLTEFTAVGTAVRIPGWSGETFTSALSAQEFWQLYQLGYLPTGVAMGVCSYYMYTDNDTQNLLYSWWGGNNRNNAEVPLYTGGLQYARETAMDRLTSDIIAHNADGVVGMDVEVEMEHVEYESGNRRYHDLVAHFLALGTSVRYEPRVAVPQPLSTLMCIDLTAKRKGRHGVTRLDQLAAGHTGETGSPEISAENAPTVSE